MCHYSVYINTNGESIDLVAASAGEEYPNGELIYVFRDENHMAIAQFKATSVLGWRCDGLAL